MRKLARYSLVAISVTLVVAAGTNCMVDLSAEGRVRDEVSNRRLTGLPIGDVADMLRKEGWQYHQGTATFEKRRTRWFLGVVPWDSIPLAQVELSTEGRVLEVRYIEGSPYL